MWVIIGILIYFRFGLQVKVIGWIWVLPIHIPYFPEVEVVVEHLRFDLDVEEPGKTHMSVHLMAVPR